MTSSDPPAQATGQVGQTHILVVDDDGEIRRLVAKFLRENGFHVLLARDGREMLACLATAHIDLIVLDVMLPGTSGLDLCRDLRRTSQLPVIMLTAKGDDTDRIVGLEIGADDYLGKPFNPRELLARINAVLRRSHAASKPDNHPRALPSHAPRAYNFGGWRIDLLKRELLNPSGVVIDLSAAEYDLLVTFAEAPQRVLSRDHLLDAARNRQASGFDRSIDVLVSRLRRKIDSDDADESTSLVKTVRGQGYLFVSTVTVA
jgi:two-component system, OmpR family, response regulator